MTSEGIDGGEVPDKDLVQDALSRIPGRYLDKAPKPKPEAVAALGQRSAWFNAVWKALTRFKTARSTLIAAGTAYYAFVAIFSLLALAYGIAALLNVDNMADWLTRVLQDALPGLIGPDGIDPDKLARVGQTTSLVGLIFLLVSGAAVMVAVSNSLHTLYGAPPDGRNFVVKRIYLLMWLVLLGPLILLSYALVTAATAFGGDILGEFGIESGFATTAAILGANLLAFVLDIGILWLLLGNLGGVRPDWRALLPGAVLGAVVIGVFKELMTLIIAFSIDKPQYGSFAIPIGVLLVFWLQSLGLYASASLVAGVAETKELHPKVQEAVQA